MTGQHLTDDQFAELLSGEYCVEASRHMEMCAPCRSEFERVQASIEDFGTLGLLWAQQRPSPRVCTPWLRGWHADGTRTAAAVLLAAVLFGAYQEKRAQGPVLDPVAAAAPACSQSEVEDDNRLMMAIAKETRWQAESPDAVKDLAKGRIHSRISRKLAN